MTTTNQNEILTEAPPAPGDDEEKRVASLFPPLSEVIDAKLLAALRSARKAAHEAEAALARAIALESSAEGAEARAEVMRAVSLASVKASSALRYCGTAEGLDQASSELALRKQVRDIMGPDYVDPEVCS